MKIVLILSMYALIYSLLGCASSPSIQNASGSRVVDVPVESRGPIRGVGVGSSDIVSMTNQMARDMLSTPSLMGDGKVAPRVIIDSQHFEIQGNQPINRDVISQRLLVELNRASGGRLMFVGRRHEGMVEEERQRKREGDTDAGSKAMTSAKLGADFRLAGTFSTLDQFDNKSGMQQRYSLFVFEMIDLESGAIVWTDRYEVQRAGSDDVVYR